jgi:hypothetical protein
LQTTFCFSSSSITHPFLHPTIFHYLFANAVLAYSFTPELLWEICLPSRPEILNKCCIKEKIRWLFYVLYAEVSEVDTSWAPCVGARTCNVGCFVKPYRATRNNTVEQTPPSFMSGISRLERTLWNLPAHHQCNNGRAGPNHAPLPRRLMRGQGMPLTAGCRISRAPISKVTSRGHV